MNCNNIQQPVKQYSIYAGIIIAIIAYYKTNHVHSLINDVTITLPVVSIIEPDVTVHVQLPSTLTNTQLIPSSTNIRPQPTLATAQLIPISTSSRPKPENLITASSRVSMGLIIGVVAGALCVITLVLCLLVVIVAVTRYKSHSAKANVHVYDYVEPPNLPARRSTEITTNVNTAYGNNIQIKQNVAYASNSIATEPI